MLITGAFGGVGSHAVQLAKACGAEAHRYDLVLDIAGTPSLTRLRRALTPTGTAVILGGEEGGRFAGGIDR